MSRPFSRVSRLWQIFRVFQRYGLREFIDNKPRDLPQSRGVRARLALQELGPVFIKFGQALSTRPDIIPVDVAHELAQLQDNVEAFSGVEARAIVEKALGKSVTEAFADFDETPLAAASVAQVHAARLKPESANDPGFEVVVKVLRPDVRQRVEKDVALLRTIADFVERWHPQGHRLRPKAVVAEYEKVIFDELDLMREGANCSLLRRNWLGSELIYHPLVFWDYTRTEVLVMERIRGVSLREIDHLHAIGVNFQVLAERGVEIFFKQVFRDNFFHADMHPGNIFVDVSNVQKPSYLAVDFGIVGKLTPTDLRYLAENFLAFFNRDYRRVAELHVESGWIPPGTSAEDFESAIRTVCEPIFGKPIKDISFGFFLLRLFEIARRFNYQVQPQLVLLQKTLLTVEGLGRQLYPELDLWKTAKPIMEQWMWNRVNPAAQIARLRSQGPLIAEALPELAQNAMKLLSRGGMLPGNSLDSISVEALRAELRRNGRRSLLAAAGATCWIAGVLLYGLSMRNAIPLPSSIAATCVMLAVAGSACWLRAFRSRA